ncbi:MAG TPA: hypothetical protein VFD56_14375 [Chitinophagaceae bacterium]|nr:hypothetical protein [Chitinophagaceae bacterium]
MMISGRILIILGSLLIVFQILGYFGDRGSSPKVEGIDAIAYYIGYHLFLIVGIILLIIGYSLRRKGKSRTTKKELLDNFLNDNSKKSE